MENKIKPSDKPLASKIIYGAVIAILCLTAIIVGIVSAARKTDDPPAEDPGINEEPGGNTDGTDEQEPTPPKDEEKKQVFVAPTVGRATVLHDMDAPVFSQTLGEWRVHAGIDISCEAGATVYASEDGTVSALYNDPLLGYTVEITHAKDFVTRYSNLDPAAEVGVKVGDKVTSGDKIGTVGDSSLAELAEEPHLHFEMLVKGVKVNPMDYLSEDSKKTSLGIGA